MSSPDIVSKKISQFAGKKIRKENVNKKYTIIVPASNILFHEQMVSVAFIYIESTIRRMILNWSQVYRFPILFWQKASFSNMLSEENLDCITME